MKAHRLSNNEKCFVNICKSDAIPPPEDITIDQLTVILTSETPSTYKIPMSITELRLTPDKSGNDAIICDVAIHPEFFKKVETLVIFRDFLITIIFEALDSKYNMQINRDTWIILKNRKCMGNLINHRIQNRDVKSVYESYQNPSKEDQKLIKLLDGDNNSLSKKSAALITEIKPNTSKQSICSASPTTYLPVRKSDVKSPIEIRKPQYKLFRTNHETPNCMIAEFYLPEVKAKNEITLDLGTDRIVLEARRTGYLLDSFFPLNINLYLSNAEFNTDSHVSHEFIHTKICL